MDLRRLEDLKSSDPGYYHVLLLGTGSVASIKIPLMVETLLRYKNVKVQVALTEASTKFLKRKDIEELGAHVWTDDDEWEHEYQRGDPILHIELRRWAHIVLVAPCSANTLAKMASGLCDNLVTSVLRALTPTTPTYVFPAMNTFMYEHPLTSEHIRVVRDVLKYNVMGPIGKELACGDVGVGAMLEWSQIVNVVVDLFDLHM